MTARLRSALAAALLVVAAEPVLGLGGLAAYEPASHEYPLAGLATYYAPGLMQRVYANRLRLGDVEACPGCVDYVALTECRDGAGRPNVGRRVFLRHGGRIRGPYLVVDCAARGDRARVAAAGVILEVSFEQGQAWGMAGPVPVEVLAERP